MEQNLLLLLYITGLVSVLQAISRNYYLMMTRKSWPDAKNYCRMMYEDLATVTSDIDFEQLKKEAARKKLSEPAWIGLYDDASSWRWSLNGLLLNNEMFTNWETEEPDNYRGRESCVVVEGSFGYWKDKPCTELKPFVCSSGNFSGADSFISITSPMLSWIEAQTYCRKHHTDVASSLTASDNSFITQATNGSASWFGLHRETWKWLDGSVTSNLPWYPGQPSNFWGSEICAAIYHGPFMFIDEQCTNQRYFFCHAISPVKSQVIKLRVMSNRSVSDPAVQSSILKKLKQKLDEKHVMDNVTAIWREQQDRKSIKKIKDNL